MLTLTEQLAIIATVALVIIWIYYTVLQTSYKYQVCGKKCVTDILAYLGIIFVILAISFLCIGFGLGLITLSILVATIVVVLGLYLVFTWDGDRCDELRPHGPKGDRKTRG